MHLTVRWVTFWIDISRLESRRALIYYVLGVKFGKVARLIHGAEGAIVGTCVMAKHDVEGRPK